MLSAENGLAERMLLFYQKKEEKDLEVMAQHCEELDNYPIQSLNVVLEQIYVEHNSVPPVKYSLSASAREALFKFAKPQDKLPSTQGASAEEEANCNNSKRNKHVLRLALSMHVLYDRLSKSVTCFRNWYVVSVGEAQDVESHQKIHNFGKTLHFL